MLAAFKRRLTFANVIAVIALFVALGGSVYAGTKISGKTIKKNSEPGNRIKKGSEPGNRLKKDSVTGKQVKEPTLATVPSASSATSAGNANTANGQTPAKIFIKIPPGTGTTTVFTAGPFTITADCLGSTPHVALTGLGSVDIEAEGNGSMTGTQTPTWFAQANGFTRTVRLDNAGANDTGVSSFEGARTDGFTLSGRIAYSRPETFSDEENCAVHGEALFG